MSEQAILDTINPYIICARCKHQAAREFAEHPERTVQFSYCTHHGFGVIIQGETGRITQANHNQCAVYSLKRQHPHHDDLSPAEIDHLDSLFAYEAEESKQRERKIVEEVMEKHFAEKEAALPGT